MASALPVCLPPLPQTMSGLQMQVRRAVLWALYLAQCMFVVLFSGWRGRRPYLHLAALRGAGHSGAPPGSRGGHGEAPKKTARRRSTTRRAAGVMT